MRVVASVLALTALLTLNAALAETVEMSGRRVTIWRPSGAGPHPVVLFSHGLNGVATQSSFLAEALAGAGYLVLAPDHRDSLRRRPGRPQERLGRPDQWTDATYRDRADDMRAILDHLRAYPWSKLADRSRLALAGHSLGGYTVLGLAGAWPSWKLPAVRAVLALSPYAHPFASQKTLANLTVPAMYISGTRDLAVAPSLARKGGAFDQTPAPAYFITLRNVGHFSFTDIQQTGHASMIHYALAFLDRHVRNDKSADPTAKRPDVVDLRSKR
jgi:predicted dienelactone hydrolase